jgi:hypothetical protein
VTFDVSILIVTYNSGRHIDACLDSLRVALRDINAEVLVHDNASTDDTLERVRAFTEVTIIVGGANLGFAAACNLLAERSRGRFLVFLNPDTTVDARAVGELVAAAASCPEAGLYGAKTVTPSGHTVLGSAQGRMTLWSLICFATGLSTVFAGRRWADPESIPGWNRDGSRTVPMLSGGALMIARDAWTKLGGFDTRYFMYGEDADLSARAWREGFRPLFVAPALVRHEVGGSSSAGGKQVLLQRGKVTYIRKLWPSWYASLGVRLLLTGVALRALANRAGVFPDRPGRSSGQAWQEAWERRAEWRHGWPRPGERTTRLS